MTRAAPRCTCRMLKDYPCPVHSGTDYDLYPVAPAEPVTFDGPIPAPQALVETRNTRYRVGGGVNWSEHPDWIAELDRVPELVEAFVSAMTRAGASTSDAKRAAVVCAAVMVPHSDGYLVRPFGAWPPIVP